MNELDAISNEEERYDRLVELNVQEQCTNIIKTSVIQKAYYGKGITVHGWVFEVGSGKLIDWKINFSEILEDVMVIYKLH